ncbi:LPS-assembly protein LptD [Roseospira visakhapatnamensis]|uniref:LPS-assembly protein LptD n=1 Tax=Roseospira visakhapatnamensis TaxID=390880 RepID=A0A7W6RBZ8_9PROT|nr:LPS assembly protein LptD [Roseospira visakhapatnamensis]MBB4265719.1 LPS-assembly protein [Roseospira visakhapatnamensis]
MGVLMAVTRVAVLAVGGLVVAIEPLAAQSLDPGDLAGPGAGFREMSVDMGPDVGSGSGAAGLGILGSLSGAAPAASGAAGRGFRMQTVPDRLPGGMATAGAAAPARSGPASPGVVTVAPVAVPDVRLRPVPTTLPPVSAPAARPTTVSAPASTTTVEPAPASTATPGAGGAAPVPASTESGDEPTLIRADELSRDADLGTYSARGNVELTNGGRMVMADTVTYNERADLVTANGNVRVVEADGTTYFANYVELSSDFRDGFVRDMAVLLEDRSRITAVYATRTGGTRKDFWKGIYSPCDTCPTAEGSPWPTLSGNNASGGRERQRPLWQVRAAHVTHDEVERDIIYRDAVLEVFGIPVAYTPYLSQPDPTVYRRSGLLTPTFGVDDQLGFWTEVPYYYIIDDHQDATVAVRGMSDEGWLLRPEYRRRFGDGELFVEGSLTDDGEEGLAGHLNARGQWHINEIWRAGFDSQYASSDTYRDRYDFGNPTWLTNHAWLEAFQGRSYAAVEALSYTDNRANRDDDDNPRVLPLMTYDYVSDPGAWGDTTRLWGGFQSIFREEGTRSQRLSGSLGWTLPGTTGWGLAYEVATDLNTDLYWVEDANVVDGDTTSGFDGTVARIYPSALVTMRYPLMRSGAEGTQIVEPIVSLGLAPPDLNTRHIPNEDSRDATLHGGTLFSGDRYAGRDRVDDGVTVNYGARWTWLGSEGRRLSAQFGQVYRVFDASAFFPENAGYGDGLSDYVGQIDAVPHPYLDLFYRFRLDRDDLSPNSTVVGFRAGPPVFNVSGTYLSVPAYAEDGGTDITAREELVGGVGITFDRFWTTWGGARYDVRQSRVVDAWAGLSYDDECLGLGLNYTTNYNEVSGERVGQSVLLRLTLKTLGEISF